jgi:hypothetical protein
MGAFDHSNDRSAGAKSQLALTQPPRDPPAVEACLRAIERIEQVVDQETLALRQNQTVDLDDFSRRKSHGLLDLTRGLRGLDAATAKRTMGQHLRALRVKLAENGAALHRHLDAVQEVSAILARAIREGESDGTYSSAIRFNGGRR